MKSMHIATKASNFQSTDEVLVSWDVHGHYGDDEDSSRNWQFQSGVIATIAEAEERQAALVASKLVDDEVKAGK